MYANQNPAARPAFATHLAQAQPHDPRCIANSTDGQWMKSLVWIRGDVVSAVDSEKAMFETCKALVPVRPRSDVGDAREHQRLVTFSKMKKSVKAEDGSSRRPHPVLRGCYTKMARARPVIEEGTINRMV